MIIISDAWLNTSSTFKAKIIGKLLGDGCITKQAGRKPRFQFQHMETDFEWTSYCYNHLKHDLKINPPAFKRIIDSRLIKGYSTAYYVQSKTDPVITYLRGQWYPKKKKEIPLSMLEKHFTEETLAWWYMDDGHLNIKNDIPKKIIISTDSFTIEENSFLIALLYQKYKLQFSIDKQNRIILYDQFQIRYFLHLVSPHIHRNMYRKIILHSLYSSIHQDKRTTIYLSQLIKIAKPTFEINNALNNLSILINQFKLRSFYPTYLSTIQNILSKNSIKGYQIIVENDHLVNLEFLRRNTGLSYSHLAQLCFHILINQTESHYLL